MGNGYELIAGERRLRAAQMAGLTEIPCIIMNMDDRESGMAAMVENLQRQDLDFVEEAQGISRLMETWNMSQDQVARLLGKSQSAVANKLRLLRHSPQVLQLLACGEEMVGRLHRPYVHLHHHLNPPGLALPPQHPGRLPVQLAGLVEAAVTAKNGHL